jgi:hypothetical protein
VEKGVDMSANLHYSHGSLWRNRRTLKGISDSHVLTFAGVAILFSALLLVKSTPPGELSGLKLLPALSATSPEISATSVQATRRFGYVTVIGEARNLVQRPLSNVEAVVELYDSQNAIIAVESGLIGVRSLSPNDNAPFNVTLREPGHAVSFRVRFRTLMGSMLRSTQSAQ